MSLTDLLVLHSSPTLAGIKSASLVSLAGLTAREGFPRSAIEKKGISFWALRNNRNTLLLLIYREKDLKRILENDEVRMILKPLGYTGGVEECLKRLRERFLTGCPHEIGLFLGYPVEDVRGFIENNGQNYKMSGIWKVYGDVGYAESLAEKWAACRKAYESAHKRGVSIEKLCVSA